VRLFAALVPPPEALEHLEEFLEPRRAAGTFRWSAPDQWHVTLAFYPDVPERRTDDLVEALVAAASRRRPTDACIAGGGAFPHAAAAKVLWAGLDGDVEELGRLATGCRAAASRAGARVDGQPFRPHLTLARIGAPQEVTRWVRLLDGYEGPRWMADAVTLVASHLGEGPRRRPRHEVLAEVPLGA
jgi:RNA 2',3'-cyclic 3'-phosphodiesterase